MTNDVPVSDSERWTYALNNPSSMVNLFRMLAQGNKGNANDLTALVDRCVRAERTAKAKGST